MAQRYEITEQVKNTDGRGLAGLSGTVNDLTGALLTIYTTETGATTVTNPLTSNSNGQFAGWVEAPDYDLVVTGSGYTADPTTLNVRTSPPGVYNVKSYGAKGDDSNDDTAEIQAALTAAAAATYDGQVFLPPGIYRLSANLTIGDNVELFGAGLSSQLKLTGAAHTASSIDGIKNSGFGASGNSKITLCDFAIVGPEDGTMTTANGADNGKGIYFDQVTDFIVRDVHISRMNIQGAYFGASHRGKIMGCTVLEIYSGNGISVDGVATDIEIIGNTLRDVADCAIGTHNTAARTIISNNNIRNTAFGRGVDVFGATDTLISGNTIIDTGGSGSSGHGILIYPGDLGVADRTLVSGNVIRSATNDGIQVLATAAIVDVVIQGNLISAPTGEGIRLNSAISRALVQGNRIQGAGGNGIYLEHAGAAVPTDCTVVGNLVKGCTGWGVLATSSVVTALVQGNRLAGNTAGRHSLPAGNTYMDESGAGYLETLGFSAADLYATKQFILQNTAGLGYIEAFEQSGDPAAPAANGVRIFAKDNGAGKTQLMARFNSGAIQQIAIEP